MKFGLVIIQTTARERGARDGRAPVKRCIRKKDHVVRAGTLVAQVACISRGPRGGLAGRAERPAQSRAGHRHLFA